MHASYAETSEAPQGSIFDENPSHTIEAFIILLGILIVFGLGRMMELRNDKKRKG